MPYKDPIKRAKWHREYNQNLSDEQLARKRELSKQWWKTPKGKYTAQRNQAIRRGINWELTFEEWSEIWKDLYDQRGPEGYVMCRHGDVGPYSKENVYLAPNSVNKQDAWFNGKIQTPTGQKYDETPCDPRCAVQART